MTGSKKTEGCSRMCPIGKKHRGACVVGGKMLKEDQMQTDDDEPKWLARADRILLRTPPPKKRRCAEAMFLVVSSLLCVTQAHTMCTAELSPSRELRLLHKWCEARGDEPTRCAGVGAPHWASQVTLNDSATHLEFARLLLSRPMGVKEYCGMSINHVFALWTTLRALQPPVVVESGVLKGQGTWLIRQALPTARIFSIDPVLLKDAWRDPSPLTTYFTGVKFADFGAHDWINLVPARADRARGIVVLDDHMSAVRRVAEIISAGFGHTFYEDNWKYFGNRQRSPIGSDCYSFNTMCSRPLPLPLTQRNEPANASVLYKDHFGATQLRIPLPEHEANLAFVVAHGLAYVELPALFDVCSHLSHPPTLSKRQIERQPPLFAAGRQPRPPRSRASLLTHSGMVSLFGGRVELISWSSYYPAYVHLSPRLDTTLLQRTTPWRLGWRPVVRRG